MAKIVAAERRLPREMIAGLKAVLTVTHNHLSGVTPHDFITLLASDETTDDSLTELANTIDAGLTAFLARGGIRTSSAAQSSVMIAPEPLPDVPTPPSASDTHPSAKRRKTLSKKSKRSSRSTTVKSDCKERDGQVCCVTGQEESGIVSHIIPHSVNGPGAVDFWKLISLFRGGVETAALRQSALGTGNTTDVLLNVWWIWEAVHAVFDKAHITVVPDLSRLQFPYNPDQVTQVYPTSSPLVAGLNQTNAQSSTKQPLNSQWAPGKSRCRF